MQFFEVLTDLQFVKLTMWVFINHQNHKMFQSLFSFIFLYIFAVKTFQLNLFLWRKKVQMQNLSMMII